MSISKTCFKGGIKVAFEKFVKRGRELAPKATIRKTGQISFNSAFIQKQNLNENKYAVLYYDKGKKKIGLQFTNDENEEGKLKIQKGKNFMTVSARAFLDFYEIPYTDTKKYEPAAEGSMIVIKL